MKYERQPVVVSSLQEGDRFELPRREGTVCQVTYHNLREDDGGTRIGVIGYDILEGPLHMPVVHLPADYSIILLLPMTTYVHLSGKEWIAELTEHHGVNK